MGKIGKQLALNPLAYQYLNILHQQKLLLVLVNPDRVQPELHLLSAILVVQWDSCQPDAAAYWLQ